MALEMLGHANYTGAIIGDYIGIMENKMETTIVYWGYIGLYRGI